MSNPRFVDRIRKYLKTALDMLIRKSKHERIIPLIEKVSHLLTPDDYEYMLISTTNNEISKFFYRNNLDQSLEKLIGTRLLFQYK